MYFETILVPMYHIYYFYEIINNIENKNYFII